MLTHVEHCNESADQNKRPRKMIEGDLMFLLDPFADVLNFWFLVFHFIFKMLDLLLFFVQLVLNGEQLQPEQETCNTQSG